MSIISDFVCLDFLPYFAALVVCVSIFVRNFRPLRYFIKSFTFTEAEYYSSCNGGDLVAKVLKDHSVKRIFTLTGGHISPILVSAQKAGIQIIDTRHEVNAVFAADATARLSGNVGVAVVTAGPGVTNTITAIKNAQMAESPVLLIGGAAATILKGRGSLQDIDQLSLLQSICKYSVSVSCVRHIIPSIREAICHAMSGTPGPVFVELPLDTLYPYEIVSKEVPLKQNAKNLWSKFMNFYMRWYLCNLFGNAFDPQETAPLPITKITANDQQISKCITLLKVSKKPIMIVGSQAVMPAQDAIKVQNALELLGIPCFLSSMARGLLGRFHSLLLKHRRKDALKEADFIILAGVTCDFRLSYGKHFNKKATVVAINLNKEQLLKNSDAFWKPSLAINAHVPNFLIRLASAIGHITIDQSWIDMLKDRDDEKEKDNKMMSKMETKEHLNPMNVLFQLENILNDNTILVVDGGDFVATASYILRPRGPLKWLDPGPFGTLGVGAGFALGAKLCHPESNVVIIYGDGSLGYSIMEFDTFTRHKLHIAAIVGNDACWTQIEREQVPLLGSDVACKLKFSDYHIIPSAFKAEGIKVASDSNDNLADSLKYALEVSATDSILVNVVIGKTDFRSGSISV